MVSRVELAVEGMHCAACVSTVERSLNSLDGVDATVNLATERASVAYPAEMPVADLVVRSRARDTARTSPSPTSPRRPPRSGCG